MVLVWILTVAGVLPAIFVGDWRKRFNNAKQAEVQDRVKHFKMQKPVNMGTEIYNSDKPASREYAVAAGA